MAKYFATSLAMLKVVIEPRVMSSCLPMAMTSRSLVGSESRSTMLAASLAADVPLFIARPTSAWASAGASFVPSPVIATRWPSACSRRMIAILSSGLAWATKSSTPASRAMVAAVSGLSPVIITVRTPIRRNSANRSARPGLTVSLSSITPSARPSLRMASGVAPAAEITSVSRSSSAGMAPSSSLPMASTAPFRMRRPSVSRAPLVRVSALNAISSRICAVNAVKPASSSVPAAK